MEVSLVSIGDFKCSVKLNRGAKAYVWMVVAFNRIESTGWAGHLSIG